MTVKYEEVLAIGFSGIREKAEKELENMHPGDGNYQRKSRFLEAVMLSCDAAVRYAKTLMRSWRLKKLRHARIWRERRSF